MKNDICTSLMNIHYCISQLNIKAQIKPRVFQDDTLSFTIPFFIISLFISFLHPLLISFSFFFSLFHFRLSFSWAFYVSLQRISVSRKYYHLSADTSKNFCLHHPLAQQCTAPRITCWHCNEQLLTEAVSSLPDHWLLLLSYLLLSLYKPNRPPTSRSPICIAWAPPCVFRHTNNGQ